MIHQLHSIGINFQTTPIEFREKLTFDESTSKRMLRVLADTFSISDTLILSTCNRTEILYCHSMGQEEVMKLACIEKGLHFDDIKKYCYTYQGEAAFQHLFEVSLGLKSKILGDIQIINQVKNAYQWSVDEAVAGPFLHRMMHTIFYANKRVSQETEFKDGCASVASVAVSLIRTVSSLVQNPKILLIGTGEIGQNVIENLHLDYQNVLITNRTDNTAKILSEKFNFQHLPFQDLYEELPNVDVVISAINTDQLLITENHLPTSIITPKLFIDLGIPRAIDANIEKINGILLYNIDQIEEQSNQTLHKRKKEISAVENIVKEHIEEFLEWQDGMAVSPTIKLFKEKLEEIRKEELKKYLKKVTSSEYQLLNVVTKNMIQKVIKLPVLELKAACKRGEAEGLVDALHEIFNLEETWKTPK